jgi:hypothetical protein
MNTEKKERFLLEFVCAVENDDKYSPERIACEKVLKEYPDRVPHDSTLIDEVKNRLDNQMKFCSIYPTDRFSLDMFIFKWFDYMIKEKFDEIKDIKLDRYEKHIIDSLFRLSHNTLVNNPNFKGENPYYKRNYYDMFHSKKLWLELLDKDYDSYIEYFSEVE